MRPLWNCLPAALISSHRPPFSALLAASGCSVVCSPAGYSAGRAEPQICGISAAMAPLCIRIRAAAHKKRAGNRPASWNEARRKQGRSAAAGPDLACTRPLYLIRRQKIAALASGPWSAGGSPAAIPPASDRPPWCSWWRSAPPAADRLPNIRRIWRAVAGLNAAALVILRPPL